MALWFDAKWFDARLAEIGKTREDLGAAIGYTPDGISRMFKDMGVIPEEDVARIATFLGRPLSEVIDHAGITAEATGHPARSSVKAPKKSGQPSGAADDRIAALERRVRALEAEVRALQMQAGERFEGDT